MSPSVVTTYMTQILLVLGGLYLPWFWARKMRDAISGGSIYVPFPPLFVGPAYRRDQPFTFWTAAMYWTVMAGLVESLIGLWLWYSLTGRGT